MEMIAHSIEELGSELIHACNLFEIENGKPVTTLRIKEKTYDDFIEHLEGTHFNVQIDHGGKMLKGPKLQMLQIMKFKMVIEYSDLSYLHFELR
jgi:hypothetical protein